MADKWTWSIAVDACESAACKDTTGLKYRENISTAAALWGGTALGALWFYCAQAVLPDRLGDCVAIAGAVMLASAVPCYGLRRKGPPPMPAAALDGLPDEVWIITQGSANILYSAHSKTRRFCSEMMRKLSVT